MTATILLGMGAGFGVVFLVAASRPRRQTLYSQLRALNVDPLEVTNSCVVQRGFHRDPEPDVRGPANPARQAF